MLSDDNRNDAMIGCSAALWRTWADASSSLVGRFAFAPPTPASYRVEELPLHWAPRRHGEPPVPLLYLQPAQRSDEQSDDDDKEQAAPLVLLFSQGNSSDLGQSAPSLQELCNRFGVRMLLYEYDGYGCSGQLGVCSEQRCYSAVQAAYDWLTTTAGVAPERVVLCGRSLGSGPTVELAARLSRRMRADSTTARRLYAGVLLVSPLLSCMRVVLPCSVRAFDIFCNQDKVAALCGPVMLVHGDADDVVPHSHTLALAAALPAAERQYFILRGVGHNDLSLLDPVHSEALRVLLRRAAGRTPLSPALCRQFTSTSESAAAAAAVGGDMPLTHVSEHRVSTAHSAEQ